MAHPENYIELDQIPPEAKDRGSQKCRIGRNMFEKLNCCIGSYVRIRLCERFNGEMYAKVVVCSVWPRYDGHDGYIQFDNSASESCDLHRYCDIPCNTPSSHSNDSCDLHRYCDIPCNTPSSYTENKCAIRLLHTKTCEMLSICVVVHRNLKQFKTRLKSSPKKLESMCRSCLIGVCIITGCTVDLMFNDIAQTYGIHAVVVNKSQNSTSLNDGLIINDKTHITITKVVSKERFTQTQNLAKLNIEIGGLENELASLMDVMLCDRDDHTDSKVSQFSVPQGFLLHGPPGCGKTSLIRYIAHHTDAHLVTINGSEILGSRPGESESNLENRFQDAIDTSCGDLCVIFIDEIDSICGKRGADTTNTNARLTAQLLTLLDRLKDHRNIKVIAATNRPSALDPSLRRPGRFDREVIIGIPNTSERLRIIECVTKRLPLSDDVSLHELADLTKGYVGADLKGLCQEAAYVCMSRNKQQVNAGEIRMSDFRYALTSTTPSTQRGCDALVDTKPVAWTDIGGLEEVKQKVMQAIEWPMTNPSSFTRLGIPCPRGVLLYGPPGCCKTTLVRAAASSSGATFFSLSSAQLYSPFVGEAERALTEAFERARMSRPSILFLDEIDSVVGKRGGEGTSRGVQERLLSTLLNEMDGIGLRVDRNVGGVRVAEGEVTCHGDRQTMAQSVDNSGVMVVAATNRPDMVDDAVLRPGRFDRIIYVPPPDLQAREQILGVHTRNMPLSDDVNLTDIANKCHLFTGADLENLCKEAALYALTQDGLSTETVSDHHFTHVLATYQPSLSELTLQQYGSVLG